MKFGEWLSSQLGDKNVTMRELARASGVSHSTISGVISGKRNPTRKFCIAVASGLEIDPQLVLAKAGFAADVDDLIQSIERAELSQMICDLSEDERNLVAGVIRTLRKQRKGYGRRHADLD